MGRNLLRVGILLGLALGTAGRVAWAADAPIGVTAGDTTKTTNYTVDSFGTTVGDKINAISAQNTGTTLVFDKNLTVNLGTTVGAGYLNGVGVGAYTGAKITIKGDALSITNNASHNRYDNYGINVVGSGSSLEVTKGTTDISLTQNGHNNVGINVNDDATVNFGNKLTITAYASAGTAQDVTTEGFVTGINVAGKYDKDDIHTKASTMTAKDVEITLQGVASTSKVAGISVGQNSSFTGDNIKITGNSGKYLYLIGIDNSSAAKVELKKFELTGNNITAEEVINGIRTNKSMTIDGDFTMNVDGSTANQNILGINLLVDGLETNINGNLSVKITNAVTTNGGRLAGIGAQHGSDYSVVKVKGTANDINISGDATYLEGIFSGLETADNSVTDITVKNTGTSASSYSQMHGIYDWNSSHLTVGNNAVLNVTVDSGNAVSVKDPGYSGGVVGILADKVTLPKNSQINVTVKGSPSDADGRGGGTVGLGSWDLDAKGNVNIDVLSSQGIGLRLVSGQKNSFTGELIVKTNDGYAIRTIGGNAANTAQIVVNPDAGKKVQLTGDISQTGDNADGNLVDIKFKTADSFFTGTSTGATESTRVTNLNFANSSTWNVTGDSDVTNLTNNNSLLDMTKGAEKLNTNTYEGTGGTLYMDTDLGSETKGDKFKISTTTTTAGETKIAIKDASLFTKEEVTGVKNLLLVTDGSDATTQGTATFVGEVLNAGGLWDVTPTIVNGLNALDAAGNPVGTANEWYLTKIEKKFNPDTEVLVDTGNMAYGFYRNVLTDDSLRKRLGDLRFTNEESGIWARMKTGKLKGAGRASYQMYQVGYDKKYGNTSYGLAVDHNKSSNSFANGVGENTMTNMSLYAANYHKSGAYSDLVLKAGRLTGDTNSSGSYPDEADYHSWGYSASYELGKTFTKDNGFFIEPQAQLALGYVRAYDYITDRGTKVSVDANKAVVGRIGAVMGRRTAVGDYYFSANLYHDFAGRITGDMLAANGESGTIDSDLGYTWYELGIGGNYKLSNKTYVYGDIVKSFNGTVQKSWQVNAGVRWAF